MKIRYRVYLEENRPIERNVPYTIYSKKISQRGWDELNFNFQTAIVEILPDAFKFKIQL